jgi:hypothetical protein
MKHGLKTVSISIIGKMGNYELPLWDIVVKKKLIDFRELNTQTRQQRSSEIPSVCTGYISQ